MAKVTQEVIYGLRRDMKAKLDRVPLSYYDGRPKGEILSRVTNDVDLISSTLQETLVQIISAVVTLVSVVIFMFSISWILGARRVRHAAALASGHGGYRNAFAALLQEPTESTRQAQRAHRRDVQRQH